MTLLERRVLGFRSLDVGLFIFLLVLILGVYLAKTMAGGERGQIAAAERQIAEEQDRIVLLEAEVAHLERPERLSAIARTYAGLAPVASAREITPKGLADALQSPASVVPQLVVVAAPVVPTAADAETSTVIEETTADPAAREPKP
ncbi:MAG: cell division protein [Alphaproteobacteria bacterium]|jgi:cell division protein FtsL|nr:cell division protein [Phenylobacterium sp.]MCA6236982.1 cell division protein [Phenylobacterium sp.]